MAAVHSHPGYCDPRACTAFGDETSHHSTPLVLPLTDATWELQLTCTDQHAFGPRGIGDTELRISLVEPAGESVYLPPEQILTLIAALTEMYWRARHLGTRVVRDQRAVAS